jgi:hypothetical protein
MDWVHSGLTLGERADLRLGELHCVLKETAVCFQFKLNHC